MFSRPLTRAEKREELGRRIVAWLRGVYMGRGGGGGGGGVGERKGGGKRTLFRERGGEKPGWIRPTDKKFSFSFIPLSKTRQKKKIAAGYRWTSGRRKKKGRESRPAMNLAKKRGADLIL